jgi:hypothetical protein
MSLASAAASAEVPPDPSALAVLEPDSALPVRSATGVASSRNALPSGAGEAVGDGGAEGLDGDLGARGWVIFAARVSSPSGARDVRLIILYRPPSDAEEAENDAEPDDDDDEAPRERRSSSRSPQEAEDFFPPSCALRAFPRFDPSPRSNCGPAPSAPTRLCSVAPALDGSVSPAEVPNASISDSADAAESERSGVGQKHKLAGVQLVSFIAVATPDTSRTAMTSTTRRKIADRITLEFSSAARPCRDVATYRRFGSSAEAFICE